MLSVFLTISFSPLSLSLSVYQHLYKVSHSQLTEYLFFSLSHLLLILKEHPNESVSLAAQSKVS